MNPALDDESVVGEDKQQGVDYDIAEWLSAHRGAGRERGKRRNLERLERRLNEECSQLGRDIASLRTEVVDRGSELLKWLLAFFVAQTAALAALMAIFR